MSSGSAATGKGSAERYSLLVAERQFDDQVHDLGFVLCPTWKKWWDLTGDRNRKGTRAPEPWPANRPERQVPALVPGPDSCFIDIMMNVGIIAVAALQTDR